jgi:hypothetical protein
VLNPVVQAHQEAMQSGDAVAIAALYDDGAVLERGHERYVGRDEIEQCFFDLIARLAGGRFVFGETNPMAIRWRIIGGPADGVAGSDVFAVQDGRIVYQCVTLQGRDI